MKKYLLVCLFIAAFLHVSLTSMASNDDVLYLKSGTICRGKIIEYNDSICRIHLATDSVVRRIPALLLFPTPGIFSSVADKRWAH